MPKPDAKHWLTWYAVMTSTERVCLPEKRIQDHRPTRQVLIMAFVE